ncbi:tRNA (N6-threonylcarbamoyladenosine(37)-N6)-methyltransferase TrmO [Thermosphaera chiliense]|uniref:tRNA (N6-threonylcarbamoyladenosine(37)-N6)-methyltransferase TrmO n=2 Tax=Thermosphaera chiliense TaxID=3402707 RepID=A0A7M1UV36_9CREN|nr:tRNA (N6-threonylcarbamoyladenosine(37)-N6)-methyltransferase TrmO [Thermosphaera aggregans]
MAEFRIEVKPIGVVHVEAGDEEVKKSVNGVPGVVEIFPEYEQGLKGLEGFSHIILVTFLHKTSDRDRETLLVKPRRLVKYGFTLEELPLIGVFATDSPHRPNPIGVSIVELARVEGRFLHVKGLDVFNGTPVLDLKPYTPGRVVREVRLPEWYASLLEKARRVEPGLSDL